MSARSLFFIMLLLPTIVFSKCVGHFVNPLTDVCWKCMFPLTIGNSQIVKSSNGLVDTKNPSNVINTCGKRIGLQIGYWEPFALAETTDDPYCFSNLGGLKIASQGSLKRGGRLQTGNSVKQAYYNAHWYKFPLMYWLNLMTSVGCVEAGDLDVLWITELDPTWSDSSLAMIINPDAALFANPIAQTACAFDSTSSTTLKTPIDKLFWCAGAAGSNYPLSGHVNYPESPVQVSFLLTQRMNYKLHRQWMITDSVGINHQTCFPVHYPVTPKSRYRYEMVNQIADGKSCYPSGYSPLLMGAGKIKPNMPDQYGYLVWRKRNCTFL